jgi:hypothetical protein
LRTALASATALLALIALPCASANATSTVSPLPASDYTVRPACAAPAPGYAGCLALELVPQTASARAHTHPLGMSRSEPILAGKATEVCTPPTAGEGCFGLRPSDLHSVYQLPTSTSSTQTIAIVDAYNDLTAEADLATYDKEFGLPTCTNANGCFRKANQKGETGNLPFPTSTGAREAEEATCEKAGTKKAREAACNKVDAADGWATEISLDIEVSHAVCQNCKIVLVEANSALFSDLETAENTAAALSATEISNSWGGAECSKGIRGLECAEDSEAFNHHDVVITAAAGDDGYLDWDAEKGAEKGFADYPASSPHLIAVGGTRLLPLGPDSNWAGETVWNGKGAGGGGCSISFAAPEWQTTQPDWPSLACGSGRAVADVSADADPYTGVAIYNSTPESPETSEEVGWTTIGGTSLASPLVASVFALAGGAHGVTYPAQTLYENQIEDPTSLHDVVSGSNGECSKPFTSEGLSGCTELEEAATCSEKPAICRARIGYDGPTGVGTPNGITAFAPLSEEVRRKNEEKRRAEAKLREEQHLEEKKKEEEAAATKNQGTDSGPTGSTNGAGTVSPASGASGSSSSGTTTSSSSTGPSQPTIKLSGLALTPNARTALNRLHPNTSSIGFLFNLSAPATVRVTLAKLVRVQGRRRWEFVRGPLTFTAIKGRNRQHLPNHQTLTPGRYRLALTANNGTPRSITFQIK